MPNLGTEVHAKGHTYKSTTHDERYIHLRDLKSEKYQAATVFARNEPHEGQDEWYASLALCWRKDQFCREIGRDSARRHYFAEPMNRVFMGSILDYEILRLWAESRVDKAGKHKET
jgi:hypothetical protein